MSERYNHLGNVDIPPLGPEERQWPEHHGEILSSDLPDPPPSTPEEKYAPNPHYRAAAWEAPGSDSARLRP